MKYKLPLTASKKGEASDNNGIRAEAIKTCDEPTNEMIGNYRGSGWPASAESSHPCFTVGWPWFRFGSRDLGCKPQARVMSRASTEPRSGQPRGAHWVREGTPTRAHENRIHEVRQRVPFTATATCCRAATAATGLVDTALSLPPQRGRLFEMS